MPFLINHNHTKLLTDEIEAAESQVLSRQQVIDVRTHILVRKIYQQMTEPTSLLLAGGIGFMLGELTKRRTVKSRRKVDRERRKKQRAAEPSPLQIALNLITSAQTLYTALPIAWLLKSHYRQSEAGHTVKHKVQPEMAPCEEAADLTVPQNRRTFNRRKPLPQQIT